MKNTLYIIGIILLLWSATQTVYPQQGTRNELSPQIVNYGLEFIKAKEGYRGVAYRDPVGIWTIGYGHIATAKAGMRITKIQGEQLLRKDVRRFEKYVWRKSNRILEKHQFAALVSFTYNLGYVLKNGLLRGIQTNNNALVTYKMNLYIYAGGRVLRGLVIRRKEESEIYIGSKEIIRRYSKCKK